MGSSHRRMRLRYYADHYDEVDHQSTVSKLESVERETNLAVEIERMNRRHETDYSAFGNVTESTKSDVYDRDFHRNQTLSDNLTRTPAKEYKTNSGTILITGLIGVVDSGELLWATPRSGVSDDGDNLDYAIEFCNYVLENGQTGIQTHLDNLEAETTGPPVERVVRNQFEKSGCIQGDTASELTVGASLAVTGDEPRRAQNMRKNFATRDVDLVIDGSDTTWILEIKREYTAGKFDTALGQVLISDSLYQADHGLSEADTQRAVVFGQLQSSLGNQAKRRVFGHIIKTAHEHDVRVFAGVSDGEFREVTENNYQSFPVGHWD